MNKKSFILQLFTGLFLLFLFSCNKYSRYPKWILGEWIPPENSRWEGLFFISKDSCEVRPGYIQDDCFPYWSCRKYLGNRTTYQLSNDTLRIFDLLRNRWDIYKVSFPSPTKMILFWRDSKEYYISGKVEYEKANYSISSENLFDQVIIADNSFMNKFKALSLDSSGIFLYLAIGHRDNDIAGFYISTKGKYAYKQIEYSFKEANSKSIFMHPFPTRIDSIFSRWVQTITFIKNNRMTTIAGPASGTDEPYDKYDKEYFIKEFDWAYTQSIYLEQQVAIQPFIKPDYWSNSEDYIEFSKFSIPEFYFRDKNKRSLRLFYSEEFYLWTQILKAKQVDTDFIPLYTVNGHIQSDGRYYRYKTEQGDSITLDLGFNFIEVNDLAGKFGD